MGSFRLQLSGDTVRSLAVEADLLGFDTPEEYVQWIVGNRFTIDTDDERSRLLAQYANRVRDLDDGLAPTLVEDAGRAPDRAVRTATDGQLRPRLGEPNVDRVEDEGLSDTADALSTVQTDRLCEFARTAVTETRKELGGDVMTGIDYSSRTVIDDDARLGEDIADLESIEVPGTDAGLVERRRDAVGAALAYLKDVGEARRSDFVEELYEEYTAGYDSVDAWWDCIKRGLRQVDRVNPATEADRTWGFITTPGRVTRLSY
jgi:hypothetical protein